MITANSITEVPADTGGRKGKGGNLGEAETSLEAMCRKKMVASISGESCLLHSDLFSLCLCLEFQVVN